MRIRTTIVCSLALAAALAMGVAAKAQDVTQADKDRALAYLEKTKTGVIDATKGLSDAQWNFKPAPDRWSIAEVMEHIALAEDMIRGLVQEQIMKSPAIAPRDPAELKKIDDGVLAQVPDRSHKISGAGAVEADESLWDAGAGGAAFYREPGDDRGVFEGYGGVAGSCDG